MTKKLIRAVLNNLGYSLTDVKLTFKGHHLTNIKIKNKDLKGTLKDIAQYGMSGGFAGFTYYVDTVKFFDNNKKDIVAIITQMSDGIGYSLGNYQEQLDELDSDKDMREVKRLLFNSFDIESVACILSFNGFKNVGGLTQMKNLLTWAAVEHFAYEVDNMNYVTG